MFKGITASIISISDAVEFPSEDVAEYEVEPLIALLIFENLGEVVFFCIILIDEVADKCPSRDQTFWSHTSRHVINRAVVCEKGQSTIRLMQRQPRRPT